MTSPSRPRPERDPAVYVLSVARHDGADTVGIFATLSGAQEHFVSGRGRLSPVQPWHRAQSGGLPLDVWTTRFASGNDGRLVSITRMLVEP